MSNNKKQYNSPVQATLTGILDLFKKRTRVGVLSSSERLDGKKILIDGASSGLGLATAIELAKLGGTIIMAVRSGYPEKAEEVKEKSRSDKVFIHQVDFSDFDSIKKLVAEIKDRHGKLDIVICNAAVVAKKSVQTKSGLEHMFMVNNLSLFSNYYKITVLISSHQKFQESSSLLLKVTEIQKNLIGEILEYLFHTLWVKQLNYMAITNC